MEFNTLDKILLGTAGGLTVALGYITVQAFNTYKRLRRYWQACAEIRAINAEHEANRISLKENEDASLNYF